jgi:hypothetical protein
MVENFLAGGAAIIERVTARDETGRTTRTPGNP